MRKDGLSYNEIKEKLDCSKATISYHCKNEDLGGDVNWFTNEEKQEIERVSKNHTVEETADILDISKNSVLKYGDTEREQKEYDYESESERNTNRKGDKAEFAVKKAYLDLGYNVLTPENSGLYYDIVVEKDKFYKVQVKTAEERDDVLLLRCGKHSRNGKIRPYRSSEVDLFALYYSEKDRVYEIPFEDAPETAMFLRTNACKNGQTQNVNWAENYKLQT